MTAYLCRSHGSEFIPSLRQTNRIQIYFGTMPIFLLMSLMLQGTAAVGPDPLHWFQIVTGVLAIPAALIGLAYSYVLIKKTRLEAVKAELEIEEKKRLLQSAPPLASGSAEPSFRIYAEEAAQVNLSFDSQGRPIQLLVLRFILLYLLLQGWRLLAKALHVTIGVGFLGLSKLFNWNTSIDPTNLHWWQQIVIYGVVSFEDVVYWGLFLLLAIPLFKDLNKFLGISMKKFWKTKQAVEQSRM